MVYITSNSGNAESWRLTFQAPRGATLIPGAYNNATRWPFQASVTPGLDVSGEGRACNRSWGSFEIVDALFAADGTLQRFRATFEQRCERDTAPQLRGEISAVDIPRSGLVWSCS